MRLEDVCRSFTLSLFDDRDQSALEAVVRRSFEERIERLRQECRLDGMGALAF